MPRTAAQRCNRVWGHSERLNKIKTNDILQFVSLPPRVKGCWQMLWSQLWISGWMSPVQNYFFSCCVASLHYLDAFQPSQWSRTKGCQFSLDEILIQTLNSTVLAFNKAINTGSPVLRPRIEQMLSNAVINCRLLRPRVCRFKEKSALFSVFTSCIAEKRLIVAWSSNRKTLNLASKVFKKSFLRISKHEISGLWVQMMKCSKFWGHLQLLIYASSTQGTEGSYWFLKQHTETIKVFHTNMILF